VTAAAPRPAGAGTRSRARDLARAGAAPLACGLVLLAVLAAWVASGAGGTISPVSIRVAQAAIPMPAFTARRAAGRDAPVYLTLQNLAGTGDVLVSASSPAAARVVLTGRAGPAPLPLPGGLPVPAGQTVSLSPFGRDLVLIRPRRLLSGQQVVLRLRFRDAGLVTVDASVTAPGAP
jgi:copper(I)-binding protein